MYRVSNKRPRQQHRNAPYRTARHHSSQHRTAQRSRRGRHSSRTVQHDIAHHIARMHLTAELPWTFVGVITGYRGNPRVSTASATRLMTLPRQMPRLWLTPRAAVASVANSVVPTMASHGSPRQLRQEFHGYPRPLLRQRVNHHGSPRLLTRQFPRTSYRTKITTIRGHPRPLPL